MIKYYSFKEYASKVDPRVWEFLGICSQLSMTAYITGGCIRDVLVSTRDDIIESDIDIAIDTLPHLVIERLIQLKDPHIVIENYSPIALSHGSFKLLYKGLAFDVTTFREDITSDGRRSNVRFENVSLEKDAVRRDFTINAFYVNKDFLLIDCFNGLEDLRTHHIRFIGNPHQRIQEDCLRLFRYFRFCAQHGKGNTDIKALPPFSSIESSIKALSLQLIKKEFFDILTSPYSLEVILEMEAYGLLALLCDEGLYAATLHRLLEIETLQLSNSRGSFAYQSCHITKFAALTNQTSLPLSKKERRLFDALQTLKTLSVAEHLRFALSYDDMWYAINAFSYAYSNNHNGLLRLCPRAVLPIKGEDIKELGVQQGEALGRVLLKLKEEWANHYYQLTKEQCMHIAREFIDQELFMQEANG